MSFKTGCTTGIFDMFHIGHLNILKNAKANCGKLIVGVTNDEISYKMKGKHPIIPFQERLEIVKSIKYVDEVFEKKTIGIEEIFDSIHFDVFFKGDDWKNTEKGFALENLCKGKGAEVFYFPYTGSTSSTLIRKKLLNY
jgi:glycerol-3-phosphate cytidylyltransferase